MINIYSKLYKKNITPEWLRKHHFRHSKTFSSKQSEAWVYEFPVYRSGDTVTLEGEIVVYDDGEVVVNILDGNSYVRAYYAPWYCPDAWNSHHPLLEIISKKVEDKLRQFGIRKKK